MMSTNHYLIIGHRGAGGEQFENSMSAFRHALELNIDGIELDIHAHQGELWVMHDYLENPAQAILSNGERIPKLQDVLDLCWGKIPLNIEIKSPQTAGLLVELLAQYPVLKPHPYMPWILISSFDHRQILTLRQMNCHWALAPVSYGVPIHLLSMIETLQPYSWHLDNEYLDLELVRQIQAQGIRVIVYTVNATDRIRKLREAGVDGIFTDYPSRAQVACHARSD